MEKIDLILQHAEKAFLAEETRIKHLDEKAERIIAAVIVVAGLHLLDINRLTFHGALAAVLSSWVASVALVTLGSAAVLALHSRRIYAYLGYPREGALIEELKDPAINDAVAGLLLSRMYLSAQDCNAGINDKRAKLLLLSGYLLVFGFLLGVLSMVIAKAGA